MADPQQSALEARLVELNASAIFNIQTLPTLQDGKLKDAETALEREFASMRAVMRELQFLAEDQECVYWPCLWLAHILKHEQTQSCNACM